MIYGDPIILGGGGGGLAVGSALLSVTVPAGSTATATKNGVTITPSLWLAGADASTEVALFVFNSAQFDGTTPWTITATDGTHTASDTILITANREYEIELDYRFYIIKAGVVSSGITLKLNLRSGWPVTLTENYTGLGYARVVTNSNYTGGFVTQQMDISPYETAVLDYQLEATTGSLDFAVYANNSYSDQTSARNGALVLTSATMTTDRAELSLNVGSIVTDGYPGIMRGTANVNNQIVRIFNMWLE